MTMKTCGRCSELKAVFNFSKDKSKKDGFQNYCKQCASIAHSKYRNENAQLLATKKKDWRQSNIDHVTSQKNTYYKNNPDKYAAANARRRSLKVQSTPLWADNYVISGMYELATIFKRSGITLHVDHIVPLNSDVVCGLHCESNMQLLTASDNISKGNRHWPDMWQ